MGYIGVSDSIIGWSDAYAEFSTSRESGLLVFLRRYIDRGGMKSNKFLGVYENFFLKGMLPSRWGQENLAKRFNKSQQTISRWAKKLEKRGLIEIHKVYKNGNTHNVYVLGTIDLSTGNELLFFDKIFGEDAHKCCMNKMLAHSKNEYTDTQKVGR